MLGDQILFLKSLGFDLIIVETAGIGQSDSEIVDLVDFSVYVMTSEYGAASQLEKIDMLDFADLIVLNKFDKRGAEDALRDIRKQWKRNHVAFDVPDERRARLPDDREPVQRSRHQLDVCRALPARRGEARARPGEWSPGIDTSVREPRATAMIPGSRIRYLAEIAEQGREINRVSTARPRWRAACSTCTRR